MSLQWTEGFEIRRQYQRMEDVYTDTVGSVSFTAGRLHGYCWDIGSAQQIVTPPLEAHTTWVVGLAARINNPYTVGTGVKFISLQDGAGNDQVSVYILGDGSDDYTASVYRGDSAGTLLGTSSLFDGGEGWHYWELKATIDNAGSWELRVDGITVLSGSDDTQVTGNASADRVHFGGRTGGTPSVGTVRFDLDDIYILNGDGPAPYTDFLGDMVVEGIIPTGTGDSADFVSEANGVPSGTANWMQVDDPVNSFYDEESSYVTSDTATDKDLYGMGNLSYITGGIKGVMVHMRSRLESSGSRDVKALFKDPVSGEAQAGSTITVNQSIYTDFFALQGLNPATGSAFSVAEIDGGQFGFELFT